MARLPIPPINPNNRIPNNPFYSPDQNYVKGEYSPFIIGSGLTLDNITGVLSATGGVAGLIPGPGIDIVTGGTPPGSTATISNTGVLSVGAIAPLVAGGTAQDPLLSVNPGTTSSLGVLQLEDSVNSTSITEAATPNSVKTAYDAALAAVQAISVAAPITISGASTNPTIGVDVATTTTTGVVSVGANINVSGTGEISVNTASTTTPGIVQLNNTTTSSLTTEALTAAQGKLLQDQINALLITNNITLAGTYDASTGLVDSVTPEGSLAGFAVGSILPAPATANEGYFVIIDVEGSTGPAGTPPYHVGDWFLSTGTAWEFLNVGFQPPYATTTTAGVVELSTDAETQAGSDATVAVTPASLQSKLSDSVSTTSSTTIASSTAVQTAYDLAAAAIPCSIILAKGDVIVGSAAGTPVALTAGTNGQVLYASSLATNGVCWGALPAIPVATPQVQGIMYGCVTDFSGGENTALGNSVMGDNITTGQSNVAVGASAGYWMSTGCYNTALGSIALFGGTAATESNNTAVGYFAMANAGGSQNTAVGVNAGCQTGNNNIGGDNNTFLGYQAGCDLTEGCCNVVIGSNVQVASPTDSCQLAIGFASGQYWLTGTSNRNIRPGAGIVDCTGSAGTDGQVLASAGTGTAVCWLTPATVPNATPVLFGLVKGCTIGDGLTTAATALGCQALRLGTGALGNTAIGFQALCTLATGTDNTAVGHFAAYQATGNCNTGLGSYVLQSLGSGACNVAVGSRSGNLISTGGNNTFLGYCSGSVIDTGSNNVAIGFNVSPAADGSCQLAVGFASGQYWLTGDNTKAIKPGAGIIDCTGSTGTGGQVLMSNGSNAICWGSVAAATPTALGTVYGCTVADSTSAVRLGYCSGVSTTGIYNTFVGALAGRCVTTGASNTAIGRNALCGSPAASSNVAIGVDSTINANAGSQNVAIGRGTLGLSTGSNNVVIGCGAGATLTTGSSNVLIGFCAAAASATGSCQLAIGFSATDNWITGTSSKAIKPGAGIIDCAGSCGTDGQVLTSNGSNAICWRAMDIPNATPLAAGKVFGWTCLLLTGGNTSLGENSACTLYQCSLLPGVTNTGNVAIGCSAMKGAIGAENTVVGECALFGPADSLGAWNVALGYCALKGGGGANCNVAVGPFAGDAITSGECNVLIGPGVQAASATGSCQLAIGFSGTDNWLTGDGTKAIKPGAGILDSTNSTGTAGQVLTSNGSNAIEWADSTAPAVYTANKALTSGTPIDLLSWSGGIRMGSLAIFATDNSTNVKWANITVGSVTGVGTTSVITQSVGVGNFTITAGGGGETIVTFTPSATLASVDFVYQYSAAFGAQPSVL